MTPKQIGAAVRKARGQRSISEVAEAAGLERHQVTGIEQAKKERKKTTNGPHGKRRGPAWRLPGCYGLAYPLRKPLVNAGK